jgi:deoxyribose-phosphate aldolase
MGENMPAVFARWAALTEFGLTPEELAKRIDHTQLRAYATRVDIEELCDEAVEHRFHTVTVNPAWTTFCAKRLAGTAVGVNPTIGFPLGATTAHVKIEETREAVRNGATELDMVINIGALKSGYHEFVRKEIEAIVRVAKERPVKVILEISYLSEDEKRRVCELSVTAGAAYVKTSTGFGAAGATAADVRLMRSVVGNRAGVKAAGGIRSLREALAMLEAGADRLGTSAGVAILSELHAVRPGSPSSR